MAFKLRSGNTTPFKKMGSSPYKIDPSTAKAKGKTKEQLLQEGFSQVEADQMMKTGATTGQQGKPNVIHHELMHGKIVHKDGKKYWQAPDGSLHTGQVSDWKAEAETDKKMSPNKQRPPEPYTAATDTSNIPDWDEYPKEMKEYYKELPDEGRKALIEKQKTIKPVVIKDTVYANIDEKGDTTYYKKDSRPKMKSVPHGKKGKKYISSSPAKQKKKKKETYGGRDKKVVEKELKEHRKNIDKATTEKEKARHSKKYYSTMF